MKTETVVLTLYHIVYCQVNVFLNRLNGQPIGVSVLGIFVIDKNTILAVWNLAFTSFISCLHFRLSVITPCSGNGPSPLLGIYRSITLSQSQHFIYFYTS